jgi:inositol phosphorylceramide mannosyltransferase catalytic subunit
MPCIIHQTVPKIPHIIHQTVPKIPRIIHQTVPDKSDIGPFVKNQIQKLKNMNPNWEHVLYDDKQVDKFINQYYPQYYKDYKSINPKYGPARADFFRYLIIYEFGGVYLDSKSGVTMPLDQIIKLDDTFVFQCTHTKNPQKINYFDGKELNQWVIISTPKNPLIKAVIDQMIKNIRNPVMKIKTGKQGVLAITGPHMYTNTIAPLLLKYQHRRILPDSMSSPFIYSSLKKKKYHGSDYSSKPHYTTLNELIITG